MTIKQYQIYPQTSQDDQDVENLLDAAFGIDRRVKTSYRLREGEQPLDDLSFVARDKDNAIIGSLSFWQIHIGSNGPDAILLGPLSVVLENQGYGIGGTLMKHGITAARRAGHQLILLVGDYDYYSRVGFKKCPRGQITMPGPVDLERLLYLELQPGTFEKTNGLVLSPSRYRTAPFNNNLGNK